MLASHTAPTQVSKGAAAAQFLALVSALGLQLPVPSSGLRAQALKLAVQVLGEYGVHVAGTGAEGNEQGDQQQDQQGQGHPQRQAASGSEASNKCVPQPERALPPSQVGVAASFRSILAICLLLTHDT